MGMILRTAYGWAPWTRAAEFFKMLWLKPTDATIC